MATERALITIGLDGSRHHLDWADVVEAGWSSSDASIVITTWPGAHTARVKVMVRSDRRFAAVVAERVATSQVLRRAVPLSETVDAIVVATRVSARSAVMWRVMIDGGSADDVVVAAAAARAVAELRALTGC